MFLSVTGSSYAMMAGYLAGHVPDSLKHLLPEMQQHWPTSAHSEGNHTRNSRLFKEIQYVTLMNGAR